MKQESKRNNHLAKLFLALSLATVSSELLAQVQQTAAYKEFRITIEKTENGIKLESLKGSAWLNLSFTVDNDKPQAIDEYGLIKLNNVSSAKDSNLADFLFTVTKTNDGAILKGVEGVAWTELSFTLPQKGKQTINQFGMTQ